MVLSHQTHLPLSPTHLKSCIHTICTIQIKQNTTCVRGLNHLIYCIKNENKQVLMSISRLKIQVCGYHAVCQEARSTEEENLGFRSLMCKFLYFHVCCWHVSKSSSLVYHFISSSSMNLNQESGFQNSRSCFFLICP